MSVVCLCNGLTEDAVRAAVAAGARRPKEVYCGCGGRAQCGGCAGAVLAVLREANAR